MRLKRNDLIKEFEEIVTQEIINHNKQIEQSYQSICQIRKEIEESKKYNSERLLNFQVVSNESIFKLFKALEDQKDHLKKNHQRFKDSSYELKKKIQGIEEKVFSLSLIDFDEKIKFSESQTKNVYEKRINSLEQKFKELFEKYSSFTRMIQNHFQAYENSFYERCNLHEKKLEVYKEKIECLETEIIGLKKLHTNSKREIFINQKQLENIYTLLEEHGIKNRGRK